MHGLVTVDIKAESKVPPQLAMQRNTKDNRKEKDKQPFLLILETLNRIFLKPRFPGKRLRCRNTSRCFASHDPQRYGRRYS